MELRRIRPGEWEAYRTMRLRALQLAPEAYGATFAEDDARPQADWMALAERGATAEDSAMFVLDRGGALGGSALVTRNPERPGAATVFQMWLDEDLRGSGWAKQILDAAERFARDLGALVVELGVQDENPRAQRFYERCGYTPSGEDEANVRGGQTIGMRKLLGVTE